jgi:DNA-binding Lrp family transcriptional regulator
VENKKVKGSTRMDTVRRRGEKMNKSKHGYRMDKADRMILNEIQKKFPITSRPYLSLARRLKLKEREIRERVQRLKDVGIIRRIGASFSAKSVGFSSTLCAAKVSESKIEEFVSVVNTYPGVTHNYEREGEFNIWFTLIAPSRKRIEQILHQISLRTGVKDIIDLPALKTFKISVDFNFD